MTTRIRGWAFTAAVVAVGATVSAQNVPAQFVVSGKAAEQIQDFTTINLATAQRIAEACQKLAVEQKVGISIYILDNDGTHVYMDRLDGQTHLNIVTAEMKARTALAQRAPSKALMNRVRRNAHEEMQRIVMDLFPNSGALPIVVNKQMIGVIGIGGSAPRVPVWSDEICGHKALQAVLGPEHVAPLLEDLPAPRAQPPTPPVPSPRFAALTPPTTSVSNPAWVVSGRAAANIFEGNHISLATAKNVARVCRDFAARSGGGASIYVLDPHGELVHMERMDGQAPDDVRTAFLKAETALRTRVPTSVYDAEIRNNPAGQNRRVLQFRHFTMPGGLPIVVDGQMIGAIGVGGGAGAGGDENCAIEGLKAAFGEHVLLPEYPAPAAR